jgi:hypothetical protein
VTFVRFPESLADEVVAVLSSSGVDDRGRAVLFLKGWRAVEGSVSPDDGGVLLVRLVSDAGGAVAVRLSAAAVPDAYAAPMPGEEGLDEPWSALAVNLGLVVKETIETRPRDMTGELALRL